MNVDTKAADLLLQPDMDPGRSLATDRHFMNTTQRAARPRALLRVHSMCGDVVCLGRYHLDPGTRASGALRVTRRHTGGRAAPFGDGFVGVSLVLPHRSALYGNDPYTLAPHQVMNRYVRGILEALKDAGLAVFYPGRDVITVNRRVLGFVSFEENAAGTLLFEAILANTRDFSVLPGWLESVDPAGVVKIEMPPPDSTTSLARELGTELSFAGVAELLRRGYSKQHGFSCVERKLTPLEQQAIDAVAAREIDGGSWLEQRRPRSDLDHQALLWTQLGAFEAHFSVEQDRFLKEVTFAGDFLANSPGIDLLEEKLRLCPLRRAALESAVGEVYSAPANFILGIGRPRTITDLLLRGIGQ